MSEHPMQPVILDEDGIVRFQKNAIVAFLIDWATPKGMDMNALARMEFSDEDREQFAQLIGYSVSGFGDLSYAREHVVDEADKQAAKLLAEKATGG